MLTVLRKIKLAFFYGMNDGVTPGFNCILKFIVARDKLRTTSNLAIQTLVNKIHTVAIKGQGQDKRVKNAVFRG